MGTITLERLPEYFDRWGVRAEYRDGWLDVGRASGGFDAIYGVTVHHSATPPSTTVASAIRYALTAEDAPIGNGTLTRDKDGPKIVMYAGKASNTAGKGGPRWTSRGVIPRDGANRVTVALEAENDGVGEQWSDDQCDLYVRACVAILDWANHQTPGVPLGPGDVFAHFEWTPGRKIDPAGPSRFSGDRNASWDMDLFRGEVFALMLAGPGHDEPQPPIQPSPYRAGTPEPTMGYTGVSPAVENLQQVLTFWNWMPCQDLAGTFGDCTWQGVVNAQLAIGVPADGVWNEQTARAYSEFVDAMENLRPPCAMPPPLHSGDSGDDVVALQQFLAANGWYLFAVDGQYGPRTQEAVQQMQLYARSQGHDPGPIDGEYSDRTRNAICPLV